MPQLANKVALITGGGSGIGRASAEIMASRGATVIVADIDDAGARGTVERIEKAGGRALARHIDVVDLSSIKNGVSSALEATGRIDILVNNAGFGQHKTLDQIDTLDIDRMFAVHVRGAFYCTQVVVPGMKAARYGKIVNMSSMWGMHGNAVASHYCAAKAALLGATKAWAKEFAAHNVMVNAVAPGRILTAQTKALRTPEQIAAEADLNLAKRWGEPDEIAYAVAFLASPESDFITGQVLSPSGGEAIGGV